MNPATWSTVAMLCALGAMSPGPSLAVVVRHTLAGGRVAGTAAALAHGLAIGIYALLCVSGLGVLITRSPMVFTAFQWAGAAYLAWLGLRALAARRGDVDEAERTEQPAPGTGGAARDGFLVAFLNPKVAVFFIALFSQLIGPDTGPAERLTYATTAMAIDGGWYWLVARGLSRPVWLARLRRHGVAIDRLFGIILLALAARLVYVTLAG